ncbi:hypothetical protein C0995_013399 [Termitomyces sp. Mi166|nr:hypothetical protein C0995_013399 [Termitomyces sp. Mi166\
MDMLDVPTHVIGYRFLKVLQGLSLLEDEPFLSGFLALGSGDPRRSRKPEINTFLYDMAAGLKDDEIVAADAWIRLAFNSSSSEGKKHKVRPGLEMRRLFVIFYWNLSEHNPNRTDDGAANFLSQERSKHDYTPLEPVVVTTTNRTAISGKKLRSSCRVINGTKKEELFSARPRLRSNRAKGAKRSGAGFEGAQTLSDRFTRPLKINTRLQTNSSMPLKTPFPSPVSSSRHQQGKPPPQVRTTSELLEFPTQHIVLSSNEEHNAMDNGMASPLSATDARADPCLVSEPTIYNEKDGIAKSSPEVFPENMDIDLLSSMTSPNPPTENVHEILPDTALEEDLDIPHISAPLMVHEISPDWTSSLLQRPDTSETSICEEPSLALTCSNLLDEPNLRVDIVKPPLPNYPPIWAQSRQEVCESFDWLPSQHDIFEHDGRLIISHGGGKAESAHSHQGRSVTQAADDQLAQDKSIRALLTNYRQSRPLVLLIDDKYALFPYDLRPKEIAYAVLGFYTISHVWAEYQPAKNAQGRVVRYKFAFQWCDGQGQPWWTLQPSVQAEDGSLSANSTSTLKSLRDIRVKSQQWSCTPNTRPDMPEAARGLPAIITKTRLAARIPSTDDVYTICPACSQRSPKVYEPAWRKDLSARHIRSLEDYTVVIVVDYLVGLPGKLRAPEEFWNESLPSSFLDHCIQSSSGIWKEPSRLFLTESGMARIQTFVLPDTSGRIHHIQATTPRGNEDADTIFKEYQEHALTGGTANTVPFSETSSAVTKARDLITLRIHQALGIDSEFNEVLSAAYMERQKMAFHSDSERGLGPVVAGLSLGSPALMQFRVHHKYLREEGFENNSTVLTVVLRHGDILVMDGAGIQIRYE